MDQITEYKNCTGCQACRLICPNNCVTITGNEEGFYAPVVDQTRCMDCDLCIKCCPQNNDRILKSNNSIKVLGAIYNENDELLGRSASGGVFAGIATRILETPGNAVFGCVLDDNMVARHVCVTDKKDLDPCQNSKYVQSDVGDTYMQVKTLLAKGKTVFYSGVPCQIAGLNSFLEKNYDNLLTADLICHGVPSPLLFKRYIEELGKKFGEKIIGYDFRSKEKVGWSGATRIKVHTKTKTISVITQMDPYISSFRASKTLNECCYTCKYASEQRVSDLTIGDFWNIEVEHPEFFDKRGVSAVLVNTEKGEQFFKMFYDDYKIIESDIKKVVGGNRNLRKPSKRPKQRETAYKNIQNETVDIFKESYFKISFKKRVKGFVGWYIPWLVIPYKRFKHKKKKIVIDD